MLIALSIWSLVIMEESLLSEFALILVAYANSKGYVKVFGEYFNKDRMKSIELKFAKFAEKFSSKVFYWF